VKYRPYGESKAKNEKFPRTYGFPVRRYELFVPVYGTQTAVVREKRQKNGKKAIRELDKADPAHIIHLRW
jgi:hypothetical protein